MDTTVDIRERPWAVWLARVPRPWRIVGGLAVAGLVVLASSSVLHWLERTPVICPMRILFGLPCPGCGTTRAIFALGSGDVGASLRLNPLGVVAWLLGMLVLARFVGVLPKRRFEQASRVLVVGGVVLATAVWVVKLAARFLF